MATIDITVYTDEGDEHSLSLPAKFEVCGTCRGEGSIPNRGFSPTGDGSWTESERAEFFDSDFEMASEYFGGVAHQQDCPECDGRNVVPVIDTEYADPDDVALYDAHMQAEAEYAHLVAMERRYGC